MQPADQPADSKAQICALEFRGLTAAAGSKKSRWLAGERSSPFKLQGLA
jgi:hypothetical protein